MKAVFTVTASETDSAAATADERAELILLDRSGSMSGKKLRSAKAATAAAIDCIPDGVRFGIISGNHRAEMTYPLTVASPETREAAKAEVKLLESAGGTAMGTWIRLAVKTLSGEKGIRHAILLTDGKNENEESPDLDAALQLAEGKLQCDCRGVGADWVVAELRKVATALVGTCDLIGDPEGLEEDFSKMMRDALSKQVAEVSFRVWTPQGGEVLSLRQLEPPLDLTAARVEAGPRLGDYGTGSWGDESREYFLSVQVPPADVDEEKLAARVTLVVGDEPGEQAMIRAVWTDDAARSVPVNSRVAAAVNEGELAEEIQAVVDSWREDDVDSATNRAARAVRKAHEAGNVDVIARMSELFVIEDAATGRLRPKAKVDALKLMDLEAKSTRRKPAQPHTFAGANPARCETCGLARKANVHGAADSAS